MIDIAFGNRISGKSRVDIVRSSETFIQAADVDFD